jgi:glycosyltransferase involved in cell wall biosynthesis
MTYRLVSIHGMDPRGAKVGGMETHVRQLLRHHPADLPLLMIGVDDTGLLELGKVVRIDVYGREVDFVPVVHVPPAEQIGGAKALSGSLTFRFTRGLMAHVPALRALIGGAGASAEVERFEYAPLARALGCRLVVLVHNEGDPKTDRMDSILKRYWWVHDAAEWLAFRLADQIFCVTPKLRDRLAERHPSQAMKAEVLTVSVDTDLFHPTPFDLSDGKLRIVYAGRLDTFKDPPVMFRVAKALHDALAGEFEFHYCGSEAPDKFPEFAPIAQFTVRHGALLPPGVAAVMRKVHMGILVSHWEGMPCFLLETLSSGRPFGGLRLPQFDQVVEQGVSGRMTERGATDQETVDAVAKTILGLWAEIRAGSIDPHAVHAKVKPFSVETQLGRLFAAHRRLSAGKAAPPHNAQQARSRA